MIVKVIRSRKGASIIEWVENGKVNRSIVPDRLISPDNEVHNPEYGIPYGLEFSELITIDVTPELIHQSLNNAGIWTAEDVLTRPAEVQGAINAAYGAVLNNLLHNVRKLVNRNNEGNISEGM